MQKDKFIFYTKATTIYVILLLFYIFNAYNSSPLQNGYGDDSEVFRYFGMLIANGGSPYAEAFDHKPPFIYLIAFIGHLFNIGPWGFWIVINSLILLSCFTLFKACEKLLNKYAAILITCSYIALIKYDYILSGGGLTREVSCSLTVILFSVYILFTKKNITFSIYGILFCLIFFTQQNEVLAILPFIILTIFEKTNSIKSGLQTILLRAGFFSAGFIFVSCLFLLIIYSWGAINEFINQAFIFNITYYSTEITFKQKILNIIYAIRMRDPLNSFLIYFVVCLLPIVDMFRIKNRRLNIIFILLIASVIIQLLSIAISGKVYNHYFLSLIPYCIFLLIFTLYFYSPENSAPFNSVKKIIISLSILIFTILLLNIKKQNIDISQKGYSHENILYDEVSKQYGKNGQLLVFGNRSYLSLNTDLNIISPSKWVYFHFWNNADFDTDGKIFEEVIYDINKSKCVYILDFSPSVNMRQSLKEKWNELIADNYQALFYVNNKNGVLYKRDD